MRESVEADLQELFLERRQERGRFYAHWRLYRDIVSLRQARPVVVVATHRRSPFALLRDAHTDLRYAARLFARQPVIMLLAILGLSVGLGIATAAFSVMNAATFRGEGLVDPGRAPGIIRTSATSVSTTWSYDELLHLRAGSTRMQVEGLLSDVAAVRTSAEADAPATTAAFVSGGFFPATGVTMMAGRAIGPADEASSGEIAAVVSHAFWTSRLDKDPAAVGRTIRIGRAEATIVGIAARGMSLPAGRHLWLPLTAYGSVYRGAAGAPAMGLQVFGRLLPGVPVREAEAQLAGVAASLPSPVPGALTGVRLDTHAGLGRAPASDTRTTTLSVFAVIALVLLLACANVATVLISSAITREREMGVRAAIGAGRGRIVRQLVTESLALGTVAAAIGLMFASWTLPAIAAMIEAPAGTDLSPDLNVFLFLGVVTLISGIGAGLAPAWHGRGVDLVTPLKGGESAGGRRSAPRRLRSGLVMVQAAISMLLIVVSALFVRATVRAATIDVGFDASGLYTVSPGLGDPFAGGGTAIERFWMRADPEVRSVQGVQAVSLAEPAPFGELTRVSMTRDQPARVVALYGVREEYFEAVGLRLMAGRGFTREEIAARAPVAIVSASLARTYWPGGSPIGELLPQEIPLAAARPVIVGVAADAITARLHDKNALALYEPLDPASERFAQLLIRVAPGSTGVIDDVSRRLRAMDPDADVTIASVATLVRQEANRPRMLAMLTGIVGGVAILLCVIGLYGLTASLVGQRAREMAVRAALGASPRDLLRLLMWQSLKPVVIGLAAGSGAALLAGGLLGAAMFFGVPPQDPLALGAAALVLLTASAIAVLLPTRRASAVDASLVLKRS